MFSVHGITNFVNYEQGIIFMIRSLIIFCILLSLPITLWSVPQTDVDEAISFLKTACVISGEKLSIDAGVGGSLSIKKLKNSALTPNEIEIVKALILGQKKDINKQLYSDYAAAGAIHILAVSGLHVGIIYFILITLLRPLKRLFKHELIISIIIVISPWGFAFLTGLSPSRIRALIAVGAV